MRCLWRQRFGLSYRHQGKRLLDLFGALFGLTLLSPVLVMVALLVRLRLGAPVLFRQTRPGWCEQPFQLLKFRTMTDARDAAGRPLDDAARLTPLGRWLRGASLDELPELINVLRGEMSLVGPRPLLTEYLPLYTARQRLRHSVRPGLTGLAQVRGRNAQSWAELLELDAQYAERLSWRLDLQILAATIPLVLSRQGISHPGHDTMPRFDVRG